MASTALAHRASQRPARYLVRATAPHHFKPIASGDVVRDSRETPLAEHLRRHYNDAVAIEMESAGAAEAAHNNDVPLLAIRGISDKADGSKQSTDKAGWQNTAADNAARFTLAVAGAILKDSAPSWRPADPEIDPPRWRTLIPMLLFCVGYPVILLTAIAATRGLPTAGGVLTALGLLFAAFNLAGNALGYLSRGRAHAANIKQAPDLDDLLLQRAGGRILVAMLFACLVGGWYVARNSLWPVPTYLGEAALLVYVLVVLFHKEWRRREKQKKEWPRRLGPVSKISASSVHDELRRIEKEIEEIAGKDYGKSIEFRDKVRWALDQLAGAGAELTERAKSPRRSILADPANWYNGELLLWCYIALGLAALPGMWVVVFRMTPEPLWLAAIRLILITATYFGMVILACELKHRHERWKAKTLAAEIDREVNRLGGIPNREGDAKLGLRLDDHPGRLARIRSMILP
jgi:hypothetical protein